MKWLICILIIFKSFVTFSESAFVYDSVDVYLYPDTLWGNNKYDNLNCLIFNKSSDTLLLINEFYAMGIYENVIGFPMGYYYPNIIFFNPIKRPNFDADGRYKINYSVIPSMFGIPPRSSINIFINISEVKEILSTKDWQVFTWFDFARAKVLRSLMMKFAPESMDSFRKMISFKKSPRAKIKSSFPKLDSLSNPPNYNFIQEAFR